MPTETDGPDVVPARPEFAAGVQAPTGSGVPLSVPELRHLLSRVAFGLPMTSWHYRLWSMWRRVHQAIAKAFHYRRRLARAAEVQL